MLPAIIGGKRTEVDIDESKFGRQKYNRGRLVEGQWVFGGVERTMGNAFWLKFSRVCGHTVSHYTTIYEVTVTSKNLL